MSLGATPLAPRTSLLLTKAGFRHGFFTRKGGTSKAPFHSLNASSAVGDDPRAVSENLRRIAEYIDVSVDQLYTPRQVHGDLHLEATSEQSSEEFCTREGDAVFTREACVAIGVRTADCVPVLIGCRRTGLVSATHSGWRGSEQNIAGKTVRTLLAAGATELVAAIGPHIELESFETSPEIAERLLKISPSRDIVSNAWERPHINLRLLTRLQLEQAGLASSNIDDVAGDTFANGEDFFSYRRDGERAGRLLSVIRGR